MVAVSLETHIGLLTIQYASRYVNKNTAMIYCSMSDSAGGGIGTLTDILLTIAIVSVASKWQSQLKETNSSVL